METAAEKPQWEYTHAFDGGTKECGELLLDLRMYFDTLPPATRVCVTTQDPGAWIDLPAWCRVVGHHCIERAHPFYLIEKR